jgi:hypothetical protein
MHPSFKTIFGLALVSIVSVSPAMADHDHHDHFDRHDNNPYDGRHDARDRYEHAMRKAYRTNAIKQEQRRYASWEAQRTAYQNNWRRVNAAQQRQYDAEMRRQWQAYHHNQWNGSYSWNNYSDPAFLNYLHTSNPSLLTRIGNVIGM